MQTQSAPSVNTVIPFTLRAYRFNQKARFNLGELKMTQSINKFFLIAFAVIASFIAANDAHARNAGVVKNVYRQIEKNYADMQAVKAKLDGFNVREVYCEKRPYLDTKAAAFEALDALYNSAQAPKRLYRGRRTSLHNLILVDGLGGALDSVSPGGDAAVQDGSFWNKYEDMIKAIDESYEAAKNAIRLAKTKRCAKPAAAPANRPAIAIGDPLGGIQTELVFEDVSVPTSHPEKFCHQDEKDQLLYHLRELRFKARQNAVKARNLEQTLQEKLADLINQRDRAFRDADAAAKSRDGNLGALTTKYNTAKAKADAAEAKFPALIKKAAADKKRWRDVVDAIDAEIEKVKAIPVVDCSDATPAGDPLTDTAYPDVYEHVDNISLREFKLIEVDITKTCFEQVKSNYVMKASMELSNAAANLSEWQERLHQVGGHHDLLSHNADASPELVAKMQKAREEARGEVAKWTKLKAQAEAVKAKADAIVVEDCSGDGGATQIGRLDPGFGGISSEIPVPDLQEYDLPTIPSRICTYAELEALRARAAKAREVSAHNRSEWGKALVALGKMLYGGENSDPFSTSPEVAAHLDAQRQVDYWSAQQEVSHKVYWDLMAREVDDCDESDDEVSMGGDYGVGSYSDALQDARANAPAINGGQGGGSYSPFGGGCDIIGSGGCKYPDPRKEWMYNQGGFDGSEAENALQNTVRNVEHRQGDYGQDDRRQDDRGHVHTPDCDHGRPSRGYTPSNGSGAAIENAQPGNTPRSTSLGDHDSRDVSNGNESRTGGARQTETQTEIQQETRSKFDGVSLGVPSPYKGTKGGFSSRTGLELEDQPIEYRNGSEPTTVRKLNGLNKYGNINLRRSTIQNDDSAAKAILEASRANQVETQPQYRGCGGWIQVKPQLQVVPGGAIDRPTTGASSQAQEEAETQGGQ